MDKSISLDDDVWYLVLILHHWTLKASKYEFWRLVQVSSLNSKISSKTNLAPPALDATNMAANADTSWVFSMLRINDSTVLSPQQDIITTRSTGLLREHWGREDGM